MPRLNPMILKIINIIVIGSLGLLTYLAETVFTDLRAEVNTSRDEIRVYQGESSRDRMVLHQQDAVTLEKVTAMSDRISEMRGDIKELLRRH